MFSERGAINLWLFCPAPRTARYLVTLLRFSVKTMHKWRLFEYTKQFVANYLTQITTYVSAKCVLIEDQSTLFRSNKRYYLDSGCKKNWPFYFNRRIGLSLKRSKAKVINVFINWILFEIFLSTKLFRIFVHVSYTFMVQNFCRKIN